MRTLVIGIPLPNPSFDNYSFASAPSISEYQRLIIEISSVTRVVDEIAHPGAEHRTFAGQVVANGPPADNRFALADLLAMRRREAEQFFARGGTAVCFAYPDAAILGIEGLTEWRCYDWLPEPDGFSFRQGLLPGFGKEAAQPVGVEHPFGPYIREFAHASRFRAYSEDSAVSAAGGTLLARSAGGVAVAFDMPVSAGRVTLIPPLLDPAKDRQQVANAFLSAFEGLTQTTPTIETAPEITEVPDWIRKEVP